MTPEDADLRKAGDTRRERGRRVAELLGLGSPVPVPDRTDQEGGRPGEEERPLWKPLLAVVAVAFLVCVRLGENEGLQGRGGQPGRGKMPTPPSATRGRAPLPPPPPIPAPPAVADDRLNLPPESSWRGTVCHEGEHCLAELTLRRKEGSNVVGFLSWECRGTKHSVRLAGRTNGSQVLFETGTVISGKAVTNVRGALTSFHEGRLLSGDYRGGGQQGTIRLVRKD